MCNDFEAILSSDFMDLRAKERVCGLDKIREGIGAGLFGPLHDEDCLVVDQGLVAVLAKQVVLANRIVH